MNEATQEIASYLERLPSHVRDIVSRASWESKVADIGQKYSLTDTQVVDIGYEVLFVLVGMEPEADLSENIEIELAVSKTLADQVADEIKNRIINPLIKQIEQKEFELSSQPLNDVPATNSEPVNVLDIPPINLPSEVIEDKVETQQPINSFQTQNTTYEKPQTLLRDEVSNFFTAQEKNSGLVAPPLQTPKPSFIADKLTQITQTKTLNTEIPRIYTTDPYREPIE